MKSNQQEGITLTDQVAVLFTFLLIVVLISFPIIFSFVQKRIPVPIINKGFSLNAIQSLLLEDQRIEKNEFFQKYFAPFFLFKANGDSFQIKYRQNLPLNDYKVLWVLKSLTNDKLYIKLNITKLSQTNPNQITFRITDFNNNAKKIRFANPFKLFRKKTIITNNNPTSILKKFSVINQESKIYIQDQTGIKLYVGLIKLNSDFEYCIKDVDESSINGEILKMLNKGTSFLDYYENDRIVSYLLEKRNRDEKKNHLYPFTFD